MIQVSIPFPASWFANKSQVMPWYELSVSSLCFASNFLGVSVVVSSLVQFGSAQKQLNILTVLSFTCTVHCKARALSPHSLNFIENYRSLTKSNHTFQECILSLSLFLPKIKKMRVTYTHESDIQYMNA